MATRACLCGSTSCHHGRKVGKRRPGSYAGMYQSNREVLLKRWNADPSTRCHLCGALGRGFSDPWEPDHFLPHADGGGDHLSNLRPSHRSCNRRAGAQLAKRKRKEEAEKRAQERYLATVRYLEEVRR